TGRRWTAPGSWRSTWRTDGCWRSTTWRRPGRPPTASGPAPAPAPPRPSESTAVTGQRRFPDGFLWGCATAAHQVEGGNHNCDWWEFERRGGILTGESADPACDHYRRFREDFRLLALLRNNSHRLSLEWSRVEPSPGQFDGDQIAHYREVLGCLREQGMAPMVTLHHFTSPTWFTRRGGWAAARAEDAW